MPQNTYKQVIQELRAALAGQYEEGESAAIAREVLHQLTGISYAQSLSKNEWLTNPVLQSVASVKERLLTGMPVQYALGRAFFMGRAFRVNESVLVPRPETEELVDWILTSHPKEAALKIIDIGTGSGCIAVSIKAALTNATVTAIDLSKAALDMADQNARQNGADIAFAGMNFLESDNWERLGDYDVIVSNPPYIPQTEKESMPANVADWEPPAALFVADADPLIFYRCLAAFGGRHLTNEGAVFCEVHQNFGQETVRVFQAAGLLNVELRKDLSGNDRMIRAALK